VVVVDNEVLDELDDEELDEDELEVDDDEDEDEVDDEDDDELDEDPALFVMAPKPTGAISGGAKVDDAAGGTGGTSVHVPAMHTSQGRTAPFKRFARASVCFPEFVSTALPAEPVQPASATPLGRVSLGAHASPRT
jgi:hypothetical protein